MWRFVRIAILLFILATVAQTAWLARARTAEWRTSLRVVIYPIRGDASDASARYVSALRGPTFTPIDEFFKQEGAKYELRLYTPIDTSVAPPIASQPPAVPVRAGRLDVILWSLKMRYWAWWNDTHKGPKPDVRMFVLYHDPNLSPRLPHSTGLQKGLIGVVNAFARSDMDGANNVVIAHELLHTLGATDKYDFQTNHPLHPEGYGDPDAKPLHPQRRAEIMAGRIALSETRAETPHGLPQAVIGTKTAREINWVK